MRYGPQWTAEGKWLTQLADKLDALREDALGPLAPAAKYRERYGQAAYARHLFQVAARNARTRLQAIDQRRGERHLGYGYSGCGDEHPWWTVEKRLRDDEDRKARGLVPERPTAGDGWPRPDWAESEASKAMRKRFPRAPRTTPHPHDNRKHWPIEAECEARRSVQCAERASSRIDWSARPMPAAREVPWEPPSRVIVLPPPEWSPRALSAAERTLASWRNVWREMRMAEGPATSMTRRSQREQELLDRALTITHSQLARAA